MLLWRFRWMMYGGRLPSSKNVSVRIRRNGVDIMNELRVMSVMAHQDDFEFEAAGLFLQLRQYYGDRVKLKILTISRGGSGHYLHDIETTAQIREKEAQASAAIVGAEYETLTQLDGSHIPAQVFCDRNMLGGLWNAIRAFAPDYVIAPPISTNPLAGIHIDHQHTAEAVRLVAYQLGVPNAYPTMNGKRLLRFKLPIILNCIDNYAKEPIWHFRVNVDAFRKQKMRMLRCHKSQIEEWLPFVHNLDKARIPPWSAEEWKKQTEMHHIQRNQLCGFESEQWQEYFAITAWGGGGWNESTHSGQIKKDFPFAEWK